MNKLANKTAIVTGASRGLGKEIALLLAAHGANVVINYANNTEEAEKVANSINNTGGRAIAIRADISDAAAVTHLFDQTIEQFGKVNIVVNNAGIMITKPVKDTTEEDFDQQFRINVKSVFLSMKEAALKMADHGRIINISSSVTRLMMPGYASYAATKAAVEQMSRVFAKEIGAKGITVNSVSPGPLNTELFLKDKTPELVQRIAGLSAFNRIGETEDIAPVILFLAGDESHWITGQNIGCNGGMA
ncbi:SDR family oxidoreductase [Terrimonas rubra]|uniref:SDR family oxidoreductase n=1 Tax=Terrimonas rubra TaxID=1035890 RepID=A0ABW5ZYX9_9BACT